MGFTTAYANKILTDLFAGTSIALSTTTPTAAGGNISEPAASAGYERALASDGYFSTSGHDRTIKNTKYVYFPEATESWGTITYMCVMVGSSLRYFGALNTPVTVPANTVPLFKPEAISISLDTN